MEKEGGPGREIGKRNIDATVFGAAGVKDAGWAYSQFAPTKFEIEIILPKLLCSTGTDP